MSSENLFASAAASPGISSGLDADEFCVVLVDPQHVDVDLFEAWVAGATEMELANILHCKFSSTSLPEINRLPINEGNEDIPRGAISMQECLSRVQHSMTSFEVARSLLMEPTRFCFQNPLMLEEQTQQKLLQRWYSLDANFLRFMLGKSLAKSGSRSRTIEEASQFCGISTESARRQIGNARAVMRHITSPDSQFDCMTSAESICKGFFLPLPLAEMYAALCFASIYHVDCSSKHLDSVPVLSVVGMLNAFLLCNSDHALQLVSSSVEGFKTLKGCLFSRDKVESLRFHLKGHIDKDPAIESKMDFRIFMNCLKSALGILSTRDQSKVMVDFLERVVVPLQRSSQVSMVVCTLDLLQHLINEQDGTNSVLRNIVGDRDDIQNLTNSWVAALQVIQTILQEFKQK